MRPAYPGTYGYPPHNGPDSPAVSGYGGDGDRLSTLKRAIDALEHRVASGPVPPYAQPQPAGGVYPLVTPYPHQNSGQYPGMMPDMPNGGANNSQVGMLQAQLNQLAGQIGMVPPMTAGGSAHTPRNGGVGSAAAEILRRQQMLNGATANQMSQVAAGAGASNMDSIGDQLAELKKELAEVKTQVAKPVALQQTVPQKEIDRIASAIAELQSVAEPNEHTFERLTRELDQLRKAMRQELQSTVRSEIKSSSETNTEQLSARLDALTQGVDQMSLQSANDVAPRVDGLAKQLDTLRMTVDDLPQTLAISRLDERLSELSQKIEGLQVSPPSDNVADTRETDITSDQIASIEGRLDEIARALVAVSNSNNKSAAAQPVDLSAVDRVEARMVELARTLDAMVEQDRASEMQDLSVRIDGLTDRLGSFEKYAEAGDLGGANAMFASPDTGVIEDQLRALNAKVDAASQQAPSATLEEQIGLLSARVEEAANINSTAAQMSNLEAQIGQIIRHMNSQDGAASADFAPVEARLGQIENQLVSNQNFSLEAAQQAAQQAVAMMGPQSESGQIIDALSNDLKSLQHAAENGNVQNAHTVQQVQQTLQQVVERLGVIEGSIEGALRDNSVRTARVISDGPVMPAAAGLQSAVDEPTHNAAMEQHANETAFAADGLIDAAKVEGQLGAIQQAAQDAGYVEQSQVGQHDGVATVQPPALDPTDHLEGNMAALAGDNTPLEPGSAAPDLDDLVKRASEKLGETKATLASHDPVGGASRAKPNDDARPDAVAAARRALQATTAEMNAVREETGRSKAVVASGSARDKLQKLLPNFDMSKLRKPLVLGAAALLLAIVAFKGIGMLGGESDVEVANIEVPAIEMADTAGPVSEPASENAAVNDARDADETPVRVIDEDTSQAAVDTDTEAVEEPASTRLVEEVQPGDRSIPSTDPIAASVDGSNTEIEQGTPTVEASPEPETPKAVYDVPASAGPAALVAAASAGDPKALFQLGMRYSDGDSVKRNMTESAKWFQRSADTGFAPAQYSIGSLYEKGIGVGRDVSKAAEWYEKSAAQGNARAMHNLAVIHAMGNPPEIQPNMDNAVTWFQKAAGFGIKDSQFNLGILYGQGMGVPQNLGDSYKWFALAAKTGDTDAGKKRDEVANAMDPDDLDDARKAVNDWAPRKLKEAANRVAVPEEWRGTGARTAVHKVNASTSIKQAQTLLNHRGFDVGAPDGLIGPKTKQAIMEFQRSAGIPITGKVDQKLLKALDLQT